MYPPTTERKICCGFFIALATERKLCDHQPQSPDLTGVDGAGLGGVDAGGGDATVAQVVRQAGEVLLERVEGPGEKMAQVAGEHLPRLHTRALAQLFHVSLDI